MRRYALLLVLLVGCETEPETPRLKTRAPPPPVAWSVIEAQPELAALAAKAAAQGKGLLLDVRAKWCTPCLELEQKTFADQSVRRLLHEKFIAAQLDVTLPTPEEESLQGMVGGQAMPWIVFWPLDEAEVAAFAEGKVPPPAKTISTFVSAEELLPSLETLAAR